jgi:hypothetical protein
MHTILLIFLFHGLLHNIHSQYCVSGGPSSTIDSNLETLQLVGTSGGINFVGCPGVTGVQEYFSETTTVSAGASYVMTIKFGTCGGNFNSIGEIWIDFNANNIFEETESIFTWSGTPPMTTANYVLTIPASSLSGQTRMRAIHAEGQSFPLDPCSSFTWGSVTDFLITIEDGVDCSSYIGDDASDARLVPSIPYSETYDNSFCYSNQNPAYNSPDVFYKFATSMSSSLKVSLCGSLFDTFLSIQDKWGNVIAANDDNTECGAQSIVDFPTAGYDTLYAIVEGWGNQMGEYTIDFSTGNLDIEDITSDYYSITPNPAHTSIKIEGAFSGQLQIVDTEGRSVLDTFYESNKTIDISNLPSGFYIVHLTNDKRSCDKKLIVQ